MEIKVMVLVPSKAEKKRGGQKILIEAAGKTQEFSKPGEIVKGFQILKGEDKEVDEWLDMLDEKERKKVEKRLRFFRELQGDEITLCGILGGLGQELFIRAADIGIQVRRIPMFQLQRLTNVQPKVPATERARAIGEAWQKSEDSFYPITPLVPSIALARELSRERLAIQDLRKPMQLRFLQALRKVRFILPPETEEVVNLIEEAAKNLFRNKRLQAEIERGLERLEKLLPHDEGRRILAVTRHYAHPRFILAAKADEEDLEKQILSLVESLPIWAPLHPKGSSPLPPIKGLGPALGGGLVSETGDINRFPSDSAYRAYARFHLTGASGQFPKRVAGMESTWNFYFNRVVWIWSTDQVLRYDHPWAELALWKKARECQKHPDVIPQEITDRKGRQRTRYDFSLKHIDARAKRWTGSQLLTYVFDLWNIVDKGENPGKWYVNSSWPRYFQMAETELQSGLRLFLEQEIARRKRAEPEEEEEAEVDDKDE